MREEVNGLIYNNMKTKHWVIIVVLFLLGLVVWLANRPERTFVDYKFKETNQVFNLHETVWMDTIVQVGLDQLEIEDQLVIIKTQRAKRDLGNDLETEAYIQTNGQQYVIWIRPGLSRAKAIDVLAHELIHLKQYYTEKLVVLNGARVVWDGEIIDDITQLDYLTRPWEREAFELAPDLAKQIKGQLWPEE